MFLGLHTRNPFLQEADGRTSGLVTGMTSLDLNLVGLKHLTPRSLPQTPLTAVLWPPPAPPLRTCCTSLWGSLQGCLESPLLGQHSSHLWRCASNTFLGPSQPQPQQAAFSRQARWHLRVLQKFPAHIELVTCFFRPVDVVTATGSGQSNDSAGSWLIALRNTENTHLQHLQLLGTARGTQHYA